MTSSEIPTAPVAPPNPAAPQAVPQAPQKVTIVQGAPSNPKKVKVLLFWFIGLVNLVAFCLVVAIFLLPKEKVVIEDQSPGKSILVKQLVIYRKAILVIRYVSPFESNMYVVAKTTYLNSEDFRDFRLPVDPNVNPIKSDDQLVAILYEDSDNDGVFDPSIDKVMKDLFGRPIKTTFKLL